MTVENGKQFRILPNKRAFNQSAYQTLRSIKHSLIKDLLYTYSHQSLPCFLIARFFSYSIMLCSCFSKADTKKGLGNQIKGAQFIISVPQYNSVHMCNASACISARLFSSSRAPRIPKWYKAQTFREKLNSVKLAGLDKAITLLLHLKRTHYFVLNRVEFYCWHPQTKSWIYSIRAQDLGVFLRLYCYLTTT